MLSDRIKKFGIKSKENNGFEQAPVGNEHENSELAEDLDTAATSVHIDSESEKVPENHDDNLSESTELIRRNMAETLERVTAEKSDTIDSFVKTKLAEADRKISEREQQAEQLSEVAEKIENEKKQDEIPLLLKYSAALKNIQQ